MPHRGPYGRAGRWNARSTVRASMVRIHALPRLPVQETRSDETVSSGRSDLLGRFSSPSGASNTARGMPKEG